MKKRLILMLSVIFSIHTIAQVEFEQGSFLLDMGSNGFKSQSVNSWEGMGGAEFSDVYDKYVQNEFNLSFGGGYFIVDGLAIGLGLDYSSTSSIIDYTSDYNALLGTEDTENSNNELMINAGIRYYFGETGLWSFLSYGIATISMDDDQGSFDDAEFPKRSAMNIGVGYAISLNDYASLNPIFSYSMTTQTTKDAGMNSNFEPVDEVIKSGTFSLGVALTVHLSRY